MACFELLGYLDHHYGFPSLGLKALVARRYTPEQIERIKGLQKHYLNLREIIRKAAGETLDLKPYEADMRHLIDTYIEAQAPRKISPFDGIGLLDLIVKTGIADAIAERLGDMKGNKESIAETIENNVRSKILREQLTDPAYFAKMSALLDEIIRLRKDRAIEYEGYLARIADVAKRVVAGKSDDTPQQLKTSGQLALYNNLKDRVVTNAVQEPDAPYGVTTKTLNTALLLDTAIKAKRLDGWRGVVAREQLVKQAILRCYLQLCSDVVFGYAQYEHIQPVLARAKSSITALRNVLDVVDVPPPPHLLHVISLKKCKNEIKKILPLLIAKNFYTNHKDSENLKSPPSRTLHLIIDEAHNILSEQSTREHEIWKDYRLELFEEIIKEGRKYGVYLTLSSQRPADISPTIVSQIHNFFIHRLVNERDLMLLDNTISTLDSSSKALIPTLAKGCCVVTGTAFDLPMILRIDPLLKEHRPSSDDVNLEALWAPPEKL
ncbi:hypothetical protein SAMN05216303_10592 [Rhodoferax sp. OV413]|uniref:ATP-binding protein n=1 Tax=Rhodoferax sp. OV413 TaxID=1855285 RepID=UPI00088677F2|nr:hypothetical protein [Rhodoferax sp. OV413]SDP55418.1 hypothetical protein SAMN05216303_10592 [Rhodoferax sp. OV413]